MNDGQRNDAIRGVVKMLAIQYPPLSPSEAADVLIGAAIVVIGKSQNLHPLESHSEVIKRTFAMRQLKAIEMAEAEIEAQERNERDTKTD